MAWPFTVCRLAADGAEGTGKGQGEWWEGEREREGKKEDRER